MLMVKRHLIARVRTLVIEQIVIAMYEYDYD